MEKTTLNSVPEQRARALVRPREHGAWGMLLMPLVVGSLVAMRQGGNVVSLLWLTIAVLAVFWLRTPLEALLGTGLVRAQTDAERAIAMAAMRTPTLVAIAAIVGLFWHGENLALLKIAVLVGGAFLLQAAIKRLGRETRMASQMIGAVALTSTAPAAYCVMTGSLGETAWLLWLATWLFAAGQIHFVQLRIHAARIEKLSEKVGAARGFLTGQICVAALLVMAAVTGRLPMWIPVVFAPGLLRVFLWLWSKPGPLKVRRLGWTELAYSLSFGVLLVCGFRLFPR